MSWNRVSESFFMPVLFTNVEKTLETKFMLLDPTRKCATSLKSLDLTNIQAYCYQITMMEKKCFRTLMPDIACISVVATYVTDLKF